MNSPIYVMPPQIHAGSAAKQSDEVAGLLKQLLEIQKQQLEMQRTLLANSDERARWNNFYSRWCAEFPELPQTCKRSLPAIERAYLTLLRNLSERVADSGDDSLDNEFTIGEFLDQYGMRLGQLAGILSQVGNLASIAPTE